MTEQYQGYTIVRLAVVDTAGGVGVALIRHAFAVQDADGRQVGQFRTPGAARVAIDALAMRAAAPRRLSA